MKPSYLILVFSLLLSACALAGIQPIEPQPTLFESMPTSPTTPTPLPEIEAPTASSSAAGRVADIPRADSAAWILVGGDFQRPLAVTHAGDARLFVVEQAGLIWILEDGERQEEPFLDLREQVNDRSNEQGLLGLAFHPEYSDNGFFFINYTGAQGETRISRFSRSADPNLADPASERILLTIDQPYGNHNGGVLVFGPDGYLYIGTGDGGSGGDPLGNGQRLDTLLGKILRIDVDTNETYTIPSDNPFTQGGGSPEIWAYGLRNPWRMAFDPATGDLFLGDVGQNQWEEINLIRSTSSGGENFGWNLREGAHPYAGGDVPTIDPIADYDHSLGCSVTGGEVVRDPRLPAWAGVYLYADYCSGRVWGLLEAGEGWVSQLLYETNLTISSFGVDAEGRIYLTDHGGDIYRLEPVA
jgi:glucose/arabinose dehydrogenase